MFTLALDDRDLQDSLSQLSAQKVKWAAKDALDLTAADVLAHIRGRVDTVFDRPTSFTRNAFGMRKAHTERLEASVFEMPRQARRDYLKVQESGGLRPRTGLEQLLDARLAYDGIIAGVAPAPFAKLDAYGNWARGERTQALSAVQAQRDSTANTTKASRKRNRKRAGFFVPSRDSRLPAGIWKRDPDGIIYQVLRFTRTAPHYEQRLGFYDGADEVFRLRLPDHLRRQIEARAARAAGRG
ncbi:hypothetical protein [Paracoccus sp. KR1-242]|uniref:hypothetical protein n=1 Tax=Paracoccus sp. KR1-242 TaxID=3410028 RepID=UPI003C0606DC